MAFRACIKIKNKSGINIEKKLDAVFSGGGYHIVRNPAHYERGLYLFSDDSRWLTAASGLLDELDFPGLQKLASDMSAVFRTTTYIEPFRMSGMTDVQEFHFSSLHNAFEEPPFVTEGPTALKWFIYGRSCPSGQPMTFTFINTGGVSKGLGLWITGDFVDRNSASFEPVYLHSFDYKKKDQRKLTYEAGRQKVTLEDGRQAYYYDFDDFVFPEGINQYSAALGFRVNCIIQRSAYFWMMPVGPQEELDTMRLAVAPKSNRNAVLTWRRRGTPEQHIQK